MKIEILSKDIENSNIIKALVSTNEYYEGDSIHNIGRLNKGSI